MPNEVYKLRQWITIAHHIEGRVRFRIKQGIASYVARFKQDSIEQAARQFPALKSYRLNLEAGSLVLEYDINVIAPQTIDNLFSDDQQQVADAYRKLESLASHVQLSGA